MDHSGIQRDLPGRISAQEAANRLGYDYIHFLKMTREGSVDPDVVGWWKGYHYDQNISAADLLKGRKAPKKPKARSRRRRGRSKSLSSRS